MQNPGLIISIVSFVLSSVLFSGFVIPQLQKLREIKDQLVDLGATWLPRSASREEVHRGFGDTERKQVDKLQALLDIYRIRARELTKLIWLFSAAVGAAILAVVTVLAFPRTSDWTVSLHAIVQLGLLLTAVKTFPVRAGRIQEADYLVRELDFNPHSLTSALGLNVEIRSEKGLLELVKKEDFLNINLAFDLRIFGFRFLFVVSGDNERVYFVSFGPVTAKSPFWRHLVPPPLSDVFPRGEYNRIEIGKFQFNLVKDRQELNLHLLVFLPFFKVEKLKPLVGTGSIEIFGSDSRETRREHTGVTGVFQTAGVDDWITYRGEGTKLLELDVSEEEKTPVAQVVRKFRKEIIVTRKIKYYSDIEGRLLEG